MNMKATKDIKEIFSLVNDDLIDMAASKQVDTVVNSANPSLKAGKGRELDAKIHHAVNVKLKKKTFNYMIRSELDGSVKKPKNAVRCNEGQAVLTSGYGLCRNIIHTVGPYYDKTNSCMQKLENCYKSILDIVFENVSIRKVAIPVISSNNKDFDYEKAVRIAVVSINNYLIKLKRQNPHSLFDVDKIYLVIYNPLEDFGAIQKKYRPVIQKEKLTHYRSTFEAQRAYFYEVKVNDSQKRGYFAIAKAFRYVLILIRYLYVPSLLMRNKMRRISWEAEKRWIEFETCVQMLLVLVAFYIINCAANIWIVRSVSVIVTYILVDIISYLLGLIFLADIQRPSANIIRSVLLIGVNYISSILCIAFFHYYKYPKAGEWNALNFAVLGGETAGRKDYLLMFAQEGIHFFFMTLIFAFFIGHLKQRKFSD